MADLTATAASQVGLAEFVGRLIREVLDSVTSAQIEQERQLAELAEVAARTAEEAADELVTAEEVEAGLAALFPTTAADQLHAIYVGAPYQPPAAGVPEAPPIAERLGVTLKAGVDYALAAGVATLIAAGVEEVRRAMRLRLASSRLAALRRVLERGTMPRIHVESGRILTKTTFQLVTEEATETTTTTDLALRGRRRFAAVPAASTATSSTATLPLRLTVRQASERSLVSTKLQVDVYGEVEVRFKTLL